MNLFVLINVQINGMLIILTTKQYVLMKTHVGIFQAMKKMVKN